MILHSKPDPRGVGRSEKRGNMKLARIALLIAVLGVAVLVGPPSSEAVTLPACNDFICAFDGDFTVMSIALAGTGGFNVGIPGSTKGFQVQSSPGQIQDGIVVYTGASGTGVNVNFANMDNAFA